MKYLMQFENTKNKPKRFLLCNWKLKRLKESNHFHDEAYIQDSNPVDIIYVSNKSNGIKEVKYQGKYGNDGATWLFSFSEDFSEEKKYYETFVVYGSALDLNDKKHLNFEKIFTNKNHAEKFYRALIKRYPESEIILDHRLDMAIRSYG